MAQQYAPNMNLQKPLDRATSTNNRGENNNNKGIFRQ